MMQLPKLPGDGQVDSCLIETEKRSVGWAQGKPQLQQMSSSKAYGVRVLLNDGREAVLKSDVLNGDVLKRGFDIAAQLPPDPNRKLGVPSATVLEPIAIDGEIFNESNEAILKAFGVLEETALRRDKRIKKVIKFQYGEERTKKMIVNSKGLELWTVSTASHFLVELLAEDNGQSEVAWDWKARRFGRDLDMTQIVTQVAHDAVGALGGKPMPSGAYSVLVHPRVGMQLLELLSKALAADAVQANRSFFKGFLGKPVASPLVTLIDDPLRPDGLASAPFDDEGTPHQKLKMIEGGILKTFFYDLQTASRDDLFSNGHGLRATLASPPKPHATNFYMAPGQTAEKDMFQDANVFVWEEAMGLHMANPVTGEFSLGASGQLWENGHRRPVRGITVSGTIKNVLNNIVAVGDTVHWGGTVGCPHFLVRPLTISGT